MDERWYLMDVIRNAWELEEGDDGFLKLSGRTTREEFERDRQQHAAEIVQFCSITRERRGFEIGSGDGTVARLVAPQCQSLDCNDLSASFLEIARAKCADLPNVCSTRSATTIWTICPPIPTISVSRCSNT